MKIYSPNEEYTGVSASVSFCNGKGETEDPHLIQWFKDHGYKVEDDTDGEKNERLDTEIGEQPSVASGQEVPHGRKTSKKAGD